jgi:hypothetical protein
MEPLIRETIRYLNRYEDPIYQEKKITSWITDKGFKWIAAGCQSIVYRYKNYIIKFSEDNFNALRVKKNHPIFIAYSPRIHYIHKAGNIVICDYVNTVKIAHDTHPKFLKLVGELRALLRANGFQPTDLHSDNVRRIAGSKKIAILDYGCFMGYFSA